MSTKLKTTTKNRNETERTNVIANERMSSGDDICDLFLFVWHMAMLVRRTPY